MTVGLTSGARAAGRSIVFRLIPWPSARISLSRWRRRMRWGWTYLTQPRSSFLHFRCNVCGRKTSFPGDQLSRELWAAVLSSPWTAIFPLYRGWMSITGPCDRYPRRHQRPLIQNSELIIQNSHLRDPGRRPPRFSSAVPWVRALAADGERRHQGPAGNPQSRHCANTLSGIGGSASLRFRALPLRRRCETITRAGPGARSENV